MKRIIVILLSIIAFASCNNAPKCVIEGTVGDSNLNGKRIFLVPLYHEDSLGVDSVVIENNKFRFERSQEFLADIRMDFHYRQHTENLLVITEPGNVQVVIDTISHGGGTPQNDSLQAWKNIVMKRNQNLAMYRKEYNNLMRIGDSTRAEIFANNIKIEYEEFYKSTKKLADNMQHGTLYDFLIQWIPKK